MILSEVYQSMPAWQKLAGINLPAKLAYRIFKYTKLAEVEYEAIEKQRIALIHEITGTKEGEDARIEPGTPELAEYAKRFQEVLAIDVSLRPLVMDFEELVNAVGEKEEALSISDLAMLEPFFATPEKPLEEAA